MLACFPMAREARLRNRRAPRARQNHKKKVAENLRSCENLYLSGSVERSSCACSRIRSGTTGSSFSEAGKALRGSGVPDRRDVKGLGS